jgi:hypothetical protein
MPYSSLIRENRIGCFEVRPLPTSGGPLPEEAETQILSAERARLGREEVRPQISSSVVSRISCLNGITVDSATFRGEAAALWL